MDDEIISGRQENFTAADNRKARTHKFHKIMDYICKCDTKLGTFFIRGTETAVTHLYLPDELLLPPSPLLATGKRCNSDTSLKEGGIVPLPEGEAAASGRGSLQPNLLCFPKEVEFVETDILRHAGEQLREYAEGTRKVFELPLNPQGTSFSKSVWDTLLNVGYGETKSYAELAQSIGCKSARAVGGACGRNPIPIFIPCHRIIGKNGSLTGFRGGIDLKMKLLSHEGIMYI